MMPTNVVSGPNCSDHVLRGKNGETLHMSITQSGCIDSLTVWRGNEPLYSSLYDLEARKQNRRTKHLAEIASTLYGAKLPLSTKRKLHTLNSKSMQECVA